MRSTIVTRVGRVLTALFLAVAAMASQVGRADESNTVEEILGILRDKGLIDEAQEQQLLARNESEQAKRTPSVGAKLAEGLEWNGDLRLRHESFWFDPDASGGESSNRYRARYRARLGFTKPVTDWAKVGFRLASGTYETASTNRSLGQEFSGVAGKDDDFDFGADPIYVDRAYAELMLPEFEGLKTAFVGGKVPNPFQWKHGDDNLIWDPDINPEGAHLSSTFSPREGAKIFATVGGFDVEERSSGADGMLYAAQLGTEVGVSDLLKLGLRGSWYQWRNLDASGLARTAAAGNINAQTFSSDLNGNSDARIGELSTFLELSSIEDWPITVFGTYAHNFDGRGSAAAQPEDDAYYFGLETGDKKKLVSLGFAYYYAEANALVSPFIDSDRLDGKTNRRGYAIYGSRALGDHVDLNLTYLNSEEIRTSAPFASSLGGADRQRLQTDLNLKF